MCLGTCVYRKGGDRGVRTSHFLYLLFHYMYLFCLLHLGDLTQGFTVSPEVSRFLSQSVNFGLFFGKKSQKILNASQIIIWDLVFESKKSKKKINTLHFSPAHLLTLSDFPLPTPLGLLLPAFSLPVSHIPLALWGDSDSFPVSTANGCL